MNRGAVSLLTLSSPFPRAAPTRPLLRLTYDRIEHSVSSGRANWGTTLVLRSSEPTEKRQPTGSVVSVLSCSKLFGSLSSLISNSPKLLLSRSLVGQRHFTLC